MNEEKGGENEKVQCCRETLYIKVTTMEKKGKEREGESLSEKERGREREKPLAVGFACVSPPKSTKN